MLLNQKNNPAAIRNQISLNSMNRQSKILESTQDYKNAYNKYSKMIKIKLLNIRK